ncbi:MAG: hypothetical protein DMF98_04440 [Acidobacteria bacterium]|nr:MAG: hypothetical protein DMF98_04440 [Acidobacteriota bacterium]
MSPITFAIHRGPRSESSITPIRSDPAEGCTWASASIAAGLLSTWPAGLAGSSSPMVVVTLMRISRQVAACPGGARLVSQLSRTSDATARATEQYKHVEATFIRDRRGAEMVRQC